MVLLHSFQVDGIVTEDAERRLDSCVEFFRNALSEIRVGRASPSFIENILVQVGESERMPLKHVSTITAPEINLLQVRVWDKANLEVVDKAIRGSNLNLNPNTSGEVMKIVLPQPSKERREELCRACNGIGEKSKVSVRNVRKDVMENLKKEKKDGLITEDEYHKAVKDLQSLVDKKIEEIEALLERKRDDIMSL